MNKAVRVLLLALLGISTDAVQVTAKEAQYRLDSVSHRPFHCFLFSMAAACCSDLLKIFLDYKLKE